VSLAERSVERLGRLIVRKPVEWLEIPFLTYNILLNAFIEHSSLSCAEYGPGEPSRTACRELACTESIEASNGQSARAELVYTERVEVSKRSR